MRRRSIFFGFILLMQNGYTASRTNVPICKYLVEAVYAATMHTPESLLTLLDNSQLPYQLIEHPPLFTCEDAKVHIGQLPATGTKNLFLREEKGPRIFLVSVPEDKKVDLGKLRNVLNSSRLTFGNQELLLALLGVTPGAVTIMGIINDLERKVELYIDISLTTASEIQCHPLRNTASLIISPATLFAFLKTIEREATVIEVPQKA